MIEGPEIETFGGEQKGEETQELIELLQDAVISGASVGFLPPLSEEDVRQYWQGVLEKAPLLPLHNIRYGFSYFRIS